MLGRPPFHHHHIYAPTPINRPSPPSGRLLSPVTFLLPRPPLIFPRSSSATSASPHAPRCSQLTPGSWQLSSLSEDAPRPVAREHRLHLGRPSCRRRDAPSVVRWSTGTAALSCHRDVARSRRERFQAGRGRETRSAADVQQFTDVGSAPLRLAPCAPRHDNPCLGWSDMDS